MIGKRSRRPGAIPIDTALSGVRDMFRDALSHIALSSALLGYYALVRTPCAP